MVIPARFRCLVSNCSILSADCRGRALAELCPNTGQGELLDLGSNTGYAGVSSFGFGGTNARADIWAKAHTGFRDSVPLFYHGFSVPFCAQPWPVSQGKVRQVDLNMLDSLLKQVHAGMQPLKGVSQSQYPQQAEENVTVRCPTLDRIELLWKGACGTACGALAKSLLRACARKCLGSMEWKSSDAVPSRLPKPTGQGRRRAHCVRESDNYDFCSASACHTHFSGMMNVITRMIIGIVLFVIPARTFWYVMPVYMSVQHDPVTTTHKENLKVLSMPSGQPEMCTPLET